MSGDFFPFSRFQGHAGHSSVFDGTFLILCGVLCLLLGLLDFVLCTLHEQLGIRGLTGARVCVFLGDVLGALGIHGLTGARVCVFLGGVFGSLGLLLGVMRYHSLRELKYLIVPKFVAMKPVTDLDAALRAYVPPEEVRALLARMDPSDVKRAKFVVHFSYFDAMSKLETEDIPVIDYDEVQQLILSYFPGGVIEW